jgi:hypothetical protein
MNWLTWKRISKENEWLKERNAKLELQLETEKAGPLMEQIASRREHEVVLRVALEYVQRYMLNMQWTDSKAPLKVIREALEATE